MWWTSELHYFPVPSAPALVFKHSRLLETSPQQSWIATSALTVMHACHRRVGIMAHARSHCHEHHESKSHPGYSTRSEVWKNPGESAVKFLLRHLLCDGYIAVEAEEVGV